MFFVKSFKTASIFQVYNLQHSVVKYQAYPVIHTSSSSNTSRHFYLTVYLDYGMLYPMLFYNLVRPI